MVKSIYEVRYVCFEGKTRFAKQMIIGADDEFKAINGVEAIVNSGVCSKFEYAESVSAIFDKIQIV